MWLSRIQNSTYRENVFRALPEHGLCIDGSRTFQAPSRDSRAEARSNCRDPRAFSGRTCGRAPSVRRNPYACRYPYFSEVVSYPIDRGQEELHILKSKACYSTGEQARRADLTCPSPSDRSELCQCFSGAHPEVDTRKLLSQTAYSVGSCGLCPACDRIFWLADIHLQRRMSERGMLWNKLYSRRPRNLLYGFCICTVIHGAV